MIFAMKNKIACYFNTAEEKDELMEEFGYDNYNVFLDDEKEKALSYSNTSKIKGFITDTIAKDPFSIFEELRDKGALVVSFKVKDLVTDYEEKYYTVLNDIYYIESDNRLKYDEKTNKLISSRFSGNTAYSATNLCIEMKEYAKAIGVTLENAVFTYAEEYKIQFGTYPWKRCALEWFYNGGKTIRFESIGEQFLQSISYTGEYSCKLKNILGWIDIFKVQICDIRVENATLAIKDKEILNIIKNF